MLSLCRLGGGGFFGTAKPDCVRCPGLAAPAAGSLSREGSRTQTGSEQQTGSHLLLEVGFVAKVGGQHSRDEDLAWHWASGLLPVYSSFSVQMP